MKLKDIASAKNSGFRTLRVEVPEWKATVTVREPLHVDFNRYLRTIEKNSKNKKLTDREKDLLSIKAEAILFSTMLLDDDGELAFDNNTEELIKNYGPVHTRLVNQAISLIETKKNPIEEGEKK